jgi:hypothetical protein
MFCGSIALAIADLTGPGMSEKQAATEAENAESQAKAEKMSRRRRGPARRLGCAIALLIWFTLLLTPCALFYLAAEGEIRFDHRDIPEPHAHPFLLISLVSEMEDRGLRIETSRVADTRSSEGVICVETTVRFLLWQYSGGNQDVTYCDCYRRQESEEAWELRGTSPGLC